MKEWVDGDSWRLVCTSMEMIREGAEEEWALRLCKNQSVNVECLRK
jgi:hypothetical protein